MVGHTNSRFAYEAHDHAGTRAAVLSALALAGPRGLCCEEIEDRLGEPHNTISATCTMLRKGYKGSPLICWTGEAVRTRSGRKAGRLRLLVEGEVVAVEPRKKRQERAGGETSVFSNGNRQSDDAALSMRPLAQAQEQKVLLALVVDRTADEIASVTGLRPQSITARIRALKTKGLVQETGTNRMTRKNRPAAVLRRVTL